jgi:hypothetical protein
MTRCFKRLTRRSRAIGFLAVVLRSYREGRQRGNSRLAALRFGRAVAQWRRRNGGVHP